MPNVLVIGATGYVGLQLCTSLLRSGHHRVFGTARSAAKATQLAALEITPILCYDAVNDPTWLPAISTHRIDIVVDCSSAYDGRDKLLANIKRGGEAKLAAGGPKLGYIYTSGIWVHGSSRQQVSDLTPVGSALAPTAPPTAIAWRPEYERQILAARDVLDVVIVRPGLIYGTTHAIWTSVFAPIVAATKAREAKVRVPSNPDSRPTLIHVDDTASGLHCAVDKVALIAGTGVYPVFDLVAHSESAREIFESFAREVGFKGEVELVGVGDDVMMQAMATSGNNSCARAKQILGWEPKREGLVDGMDVYARAFLASQASS